MTSSQQPAAIEDLLIDGLEIVSKATPGPYWIDPGADSFAVFAGNGAEYWGVGSPAVMLCVSSLDPEPYANGENDASLFAFAGTHLKAILESCHDFRIRLTAAEQSIATLKAERDEARARVEDARQILLDIRKSVGLKVNDGVSLLGFIRDKWKAFYESAIDHSVIPGSSSEHDISQVRCKLCGMTEVGEGELIHDEKCPLRAALSPAPTTDAKGA